MISVHYREGELVLRRPTAAEVVAFEEARRVLDAPLEATGGMAAGLDDGSEQIAACISNHSPESARAVLRRYPALIDFGLTEAFRVAGLDWADIERDDEAVTLDLRKQLGPDCIGLRVASQPLVLRPLSPERYLLMRKRKVSAVVRHNVPIGELASLGREHIASPAGEAAEKLLSERPYLAINLGRILLDEARGDQDRLLGKLPRFSRSASEKTSPSSPTPDSGSQPTTGSAGTSAAAPLP